MDVETLDLKKLRAFYFVARYGGLQKAASRLKVTLSAVSFSVRRLEEQLGVELFTRMPNRLILTAAGDRLVESAEAIFAGIDKIMSDSQLAEPQSGRVSICVNSDLAWYFVPKITGFLNRYPEVELSVYIRKSTDALRLVESGDIDMAIGRFPKVPSSLEAAPIVASTISLVCPRNHVLARRKLIRLADIARYRLVGFASTSFRRALDVAFVEAGVSIESYVEAVNCHTVADFVQAGVGLGLVHTFCGTPRAAKLRFRELDRHFGSSTFSLVCHKQAAGRSGLFEKLRGALLGHDRRRAARAATKKL